MLFYALIAQNVAMFVVIALVAFSSVKTRRNSIISIAAAAVLLAGIALTGVWIYPPGYGLIFYLLLFAAASLFRLQRSPKIDAMQSPKTTYAVAAASIVAGGLLIWQGVLGRTPPTGRYVDLAPPLQPSEGFCVLSGGGSLLLNLHYLLAGSEADRFEMHALDITRKNWLGFRTLPSYSINPKPIDPAHYAIFSQPVFSPCAGEVSSLENGQPDVLAGDQYRVRSGANHVAIKCHNAIVVLAHLKQGSVLVKRGQSVNVGDQIGLVGNSGNTEEPHLHIHAQSLPDPKRPEAYSNPIPLRFDGRFLARGNCL